MQAAQVVHATGESVEERHEEGTYAVVLTAPGEQELEALAKRLEAAQVPCVRVYEPDAPYHGALMALGLRPARKEALRRHVSSLPLLR
jgi:peptidyl-tRNA hydrolase